MLNSFRSAIAGISPTSRSTEQLTWLMIVGIAALVIVLSLQRRFDRDEFEAIKSAWMIFSGERIYVDFFQHHHPFLYYLLTPLFTLFGETRIMLFAARALMLGFIFGTLVAVHSLAHHLFSRQVATVSLLFLLCVTMFIEASIEVRPDVPQAFFGLLSVLLLYRYFDSRHRLLLLLSSFSLGLGFLFLQKLIVLIFVVHAVLLYRVIRGQLRLSLLLEFSAVLFATWGGYCLYLAATGQLSEYWFFNFEFNLATLGPPVHQTRLLFQHIADFNAIVLLGLLLGLFSTRTQGQRELVLMGIMLLGFAVFYRTQFGQYYLVALPLVAIIAANGWETISQRHFAAGIACLVVAFISAAVVYVMEIRLKKNHKQLARVDYVLENTSVSSYVYDGDRKFNLFRKDLDFFWFGVRQGELLDKYRMLTGYEYDIYELIEKHKPTIISNYEIENMEHPAIQNRYQKVPAFENIYLRVNPVSTPQP
jgi:4-amino-4-deoxy-L-arabinose transferase-like glycosyltransferase